MDPQVELYNISHGRHLATGIADVATALWALRGSNFDPVYNGDPDHSHVYSPVFHMSASTPFVTGHAWWVDSDQTPSEMITYKFEFNNSGQIKTVRAH
jgi:hypothetical protein